MMKKALSLLLTLAMVMSMFTVGAFADTTGTASDPHSMTVSASVEEIVVDGQTTLTATAPTYTDTETCKYTVTYEWSVPSGLTGTSTSNSITLTGATAAAEAYTVTCTAKLTATTTTTTGEGEEATTTSVDTYYQGTASVTVVADNYEVRLFKNDQQQTGAQTMKLAPNATGTVELTAELWSKGTAASEGVDAVPAAKVQDMTLSIGSGSSYITFSNPTVTAVAAGSATIKASTTYKGKTYEAVVCNVTVGDLGVPVDIVNGSYQTYTGTTSLFTAIQDDLNSTMGLTRDAKLTATKVTITPDTSSVFSAYVGNETTAKTAAFDLTSASTSVRIVAKAGSIRLTNPEKWTYTVTAGGKEYSGKLTLKSTYAATVTANQYADFAKEEFYLDSVGSSIYYIRDYVSGDTDFSTSNSSIKGVRYMPVDPSSVTLTSDGKWTKQYIGYSYTGSGANAVAIAHLVNVTFTAKSYDILLSGKDGDAPFKFSDFETFTNAVANEQNISSYYYVDLQSVRLGTPSGTVSNGLRLMKGATYLSSYTDLSKSELEAITISVAAAGNYDIPFTVNYKYRSSTSSSWSTASATYYGVLRIYATSEGDIQYDVSYNEKVSFDSADFAAFLRKESGKTNAVLSYVVFDEGQPSSGALYRVATSVLATYKVNASDHFYYDPTTSQYDLSDVTYLADALPRTEYSVCIPFTAYGKSGSSFISKSGVVEIIVNGALPFTDIGENHTFYKEIKYCYRNGIMNGKTATRFDAASNVTRKQLVLTLYRMAGSPTTYNNRTLSFTDCKNLTGESLYAMKWAENTKLVQGDGKLFRPNDSVTRQAMVTILYRFAKYYGYDTSVVSNSNLAAYKDASTISNSEMKTAMNWAVDCGFVSGNTSGKLNPKGNTTRGATAKILAGFHNWYIA